MSKKQSKHYAKSVKSGNKIKSRSLSKKSSSSSSKSTRSNSPTKKSSSPTKSNSSSKNKKLRARALKKKKTRSLFFQTKNMTLVMRKADLKSYPVIFHDKKEPEKEEPSSMKSTNVVLV